MRTSNGQRQRERHHKRAQAQAPSLVMVLAFVALAFLMIPLVGLMVLMSAFFIGNYNKLVILRNHVKNAFSQIDVQLKRRHERETLEAVIQARHQASAAQKGAPQVSFDRCGAGQRIKVSVPKGTFLRPICMEI